MKQSSAPTVCVVVTTYNKPEYLRNTLQQILCQSRQPDQVIVADDGSDDDTRKVCQEFSEKLTAFQHVWHVDEGFRKCVILNKALLACSSDYVVFIDDDCLCPPWFLENHLRAARSGGFTVGSSVHFSEAATALILSNSSEFSRFLSSSTMAKMDKVNTKFLGKWLKLFFRAFAAGKTFANVMDKAYLGSGVFRGGNSGAWRKDLERVNGFDNGMTYGHEDREVGERLKNSGLVCRQVRYSAANFHLNHPRPYADPLRKEMQLKKCVKVRKEGLVTCEDGLTQTLLT